MVVQSYLAVGKEMKLLSIKGLLPIYIHVCVCMIILCNIIYIYDKLFTQS